MRLSENFTLSELTVTSVGLPNVPGDSEEEKLLYLANYILQPIRDRWGRIRILSGYRCEAVNKAVGGSATSQHMMGEAADIVPVEADLNEVYRWIIEDSRIPFGQCIYEKGQWIHISLARLKGPNSQALVFDGKNYSRYLGKL